MRLLCAVVLAAATIATAAGSPGGSKIEAAIQDKDQGKWIELFNGKDLTGWKHIGPGSFAVEEGALVSSGGMGMLYYEAKSFRDFTLEIGSAMIFSSTKYLRIEAGSPVFETLVMTARRMK